jgi:hypothetical protein
MRAQQATTRGRAPSALTSGTALGGRGARWRRSLSLRRGGALLALLVCPACFTEADPETIQPPAAGGGSPTGGSGGGDGKPLEKPFDQNWCSQAGLTTGRRLARNIELIGVSAYQGVEIPLATFGTRVKKQNADVVQGRDLLVRGFVRPSLGFAPKRLGARLLLSRGDVTVAYEDMRFVSGASDAGQLETTFAFYVAGKEVRHDQDFAVEVFEEGPCDAPGVLGTPRYPADGVAPLRARATGSVRVVLVPIRYDGDGSRRLPDVGPEHQGALREQLAAYFPVSGVEMTVRASVATREDDFGDVLNQLVQLRELDDPPSDVTYFGLVNMADTMDEYCHGGCVAGVATFGTPAGSAAVGVGIGFRGPAQETFVHELGHVHRLMHAPCGGASGADPRYPYAGALLGSWGYDAREGLLIDPSSNHRDFMSYCDPAWISDYNYQMLVERIALVNGRRYSDSSSDLADYRAPNAPGVRPQGGESEALGEASAAADHSASSAAIPTAYRTLRLRPGGELHWGVPLATRRTPPGEAEQAEVLDRAGRVVTEVTVYRQVLSDEQGVLWFLPQPESGWKRVRVRGQAPISWDLSPRVRPFDPVE